MDQQRIERIAEMAGVDVEVVRRHEGFLNASWIYRPQGNDDAGLAASLQSKLAYDAWAVRHDGDGTEQSDYVPPGSLAALAASAREGR